MNCKEAVSLMHVYLDGDLNIEQSGRLKQHLNRCAECQKLFAQYEMTDAFLRSMPKPQTPAHLEDRIMSGIPESKQRSRWFGWMKRYPAITIAAAFILVMLASFVTLWDQESQLIVKGNDLEKIIIQDRTVIVPSGSVIEGDLIVENGELRIEDQANVKGDLIVIDGSLHLASTAQVGGNVKKVNEAIDWLWYKLGDIFESITP